MAKSKKRVTIKDVAEKAGVSITTVSRVLNDNYETHMRMETKEKILSTIEELGYTPDKNAQVLSRSRTDVIGIIVPDISDPFFATLVRGIEKVSNNHGLTTIIADTENSEKKESEHIKTLLSERVDGVVLVPTGTACSEPGRLIDNDIHVVLADRSIEGFSAPVVTSADEEGSYEITKYVLSLGHEKIYFIQGPQALSTSRKRLDGYKRAMESHGSGFKEKNVFQGDFTFESGLEVGNQIKDQVRDVSMALIAANDMMAIGVIRALKDSGLSVPNDVCIAGFGDEFSRNLITPKLTTVRVPAGEIGSKAAELLYEGIEGSKDLQKEPEVVNLSTELIEGETCRKVS